MSDEDEPAAEPEAFRYPGLVDLERVLRADRDARVRVAEAIDRMLSEQLLGEAAIRLEIERARMLEGRRLMRELRGATPGVMERLFDEVWMLAINRGTSYEITLERAPFGYWSEQLVDQLLQVERAHMEFQKLGSHRLKFMAGLSGDVVSIGGFRGASMHAAFWFFVQAFLNALVAVAEGKAAIPAVATTKRRQQRPQLNRAAPESMDDLEEDDRKLLVAMLGAKRGEKFLVTSQRAELGKSHADKRLKDLRRWGLVTPARTPRDLTRQGREWAMALAPRIAPIA